MQLPDADIQALVEGEVVAAFVSRGAVGEGDEVSLDRSGRRNPDELQPAYQRWANVEVTGSWTAVVTAVHPSTLLDPVSGAARHILADIPEGDVVVLRVYDDAGSPVLSDTAFAARVRSLEGALRG